MRPWIWPGGKLGIRYCQSSELRIGEIAVWFDGRELRSHRVVALQKNGSFVTKGDLSARGDAPASDTQLLGRAVSFRIFGIGYRLDRGLPYAAGKLLARAPWLGATFERAYGPPRRWIGRLLDAAYTARAVRAARRRFASKDWKLSAEQSARELRVTAFSESKLVGRARLGAHGDLEDIWVTRRLRGLGLGRVLLERVIREARSAGVEALRCTRKTDARVQQLLASCGFRRDGDGWLLRLL